MRYQIKNGTVSLQGETVLDHIDFEIRGNEKIALVGKNGAGKTTLLRLIAGELSLDRDDKRFEPGIFLAGNTTVKSCFWRSVLPTIRIPERDTILSRNMTGYLPVWDFGEKKRRKNCGSFPAESRRRLP